MRITNLLIIASLCYSITHAQKSETIQENESIYIEPEIQLGVNYPEPIVNHKIARELALEAYNKVKN